MPQDLDQVEGTGRGAGCYGSQRTVFIEMHCPRNKMYLLGLDSDQRHLLYARFAAICDVCHFVDGERSSQERASI